MPETITKLACHEVVARHASDIDSLITIDLGSWGDSKLSGVIRVVNKYDVVAVGITRKVLLVMKIEKPILM